MNDILRQINVFLIGSIIGFIIACVSIRVILSNKSFNEFKRTIEIVDEHEYLILDFNGMKTMTHKADCSFCKENK